MQDLLDVFVHLVNASDYRALNEVRAQYFATQPPASAVVVVKELVRPDLLVEVEAVAEIPTKSTRATSGGRRSVRRFPHRRFRFNSSGDTAP